MPHIYLVLTNVVQWYDNWFTEARASASVVRHPARATPGTPPRLQENGPGMNLNGMNLNGKIALITGSGRGIGKGIAARFRELGATVIRHDHPESPAARQSVADDDPFLAANLENLQEIAAMFATIRERYGRLDILVNNAAIDPTAAFLDVDEAFWEKVVNTNLRGSFFCAQHALRLMEGLPAGRLIFISSVHAKASMPNYAVYAATKGGIEALVGQLSIDLAAHGVTVNAIAPGAVEVEKFLEHPSYDRDALGAEIPRGRVGLPKDVAALAAFLASDAAEWITGQCFTVDGGTRARLYLYAGRPIPG